jgi:hypothetical protein
MNLHRRALPLILLACLFPLSPAWGEVTPTLNSDAIKATFGSYGVEVIDQAAGTRVANLYSGQGADKVCRTLAVTEFTQPIDEALLESHKKIVAGASIGATLRAAGFTINKKLLIKTEVPANEAFVALANGTTTRGTPLFTKVYALFAEKSDSSIPYAVIAEAYHPAHFPPVHEEVTEQPSLRVAAERALKGLSEFSLPVSLTIPSASQS